MSFSLSVRKAITQKSLQGFWKLFAQYCNIEIIKLMKHDFRNNTSSHTLRYCNILIKQIKPDFMKDTSSHTLRVEAWKNFSPKPLTVFSFFVLPLKTIIFSGGEGRGGVLMEGMRWYLKLSLFVGRNRSKMNLWTWEIILTRKLRWESLLYSLLHILHNLKFFGQKIPTINKQGRVRSIIWVRWLF